MDRDALIEEIKNKNLDINGFVSKIFEDKSMREEIVHQLLTNPHIMVYYHCYYIVSNASEIKPEFFYAYWHDFAKLLHHKNSYHRDIGLTIIANLIKVDTQNLFDDIFDYYFSHIKDKKFMTAQCCIKNTEKIIKSREDLTIPIVNVLVQANKTPYYPPKQIALINYDILAVLDAAHEIFHPKEDIYSFIRTSKNSLSPKTRKKALELMKKYQL